MSLERYKAMRDKIGELLNELDSLIANNTQWQVIDSHVEEIKARAKTEKLKMRRGAKANGKIYFSQGRCSPASRALGYIPCNGFTLVTCSGIPIWKLLQMRIPAEFLEEIKSSQKIFRYDDVNFTIMRPGK